MNPQGEMLAESELFRKEMLTATVGPGMFKIPYVWADLEEVPQWMRKNLADLLVKEGKE